MTAQTLYNKLNSGEITKDKFLYELRKQNLPYITKFNSFNDTIKILKNKSIISEAKAEKSPELPEVDAPTIDMVSPYEYAKGINFELDLAGVSIIHNLPTEVEMLKAQKKVLKNLGKDQYFYSRKLMSDEEKKLEKNNERMYELTGKNTIHNKKKGIMREAAYKHPDSEVEDSFSLNHLMDTINEDDINEIDQEENYDDYEKLGDEYAGQGNDSDELVAAKEEARRISEEEGVAQHVNKLPNNGGYRVEDWYDSTSTVASYEMGDLLEEEGLYSIGEQDLGNGDPRDELANSEFGMDYDQCGVGEKEWVDDELSMREGSYEGEEESEVNMENPEWRSIIEDIIGEWGLASFDMSDDDVMDEVQAEVKRRASLNEYGGEDEGSIETDDENTAKKLADQGKNVVLKDKA